MPISQKNHRIESSVIQSGNQTTITTYESTTDIAEYQIDNRSQGVSLQELHSSRSQLVSDSFAAIKLSRSVIGKRSNRFSKYNKKRLNISHPITIIAQHSKPKPVSIVEAVPALSLVMLRSKVQFKRNLARPLQTIYKELGSVSPAFSPMFRPIEEITETSESSISLKKINSPIKQSNFLIEFRRRSTKHDQHLVNLISCEKIKLPDLSPIHEQKSTRQLDLLLKSYLKETKQKSKQVSLNKIRINNRSLQKSENEYAKQIKIDKGQIRILNSQQRKYHSPSMKLMKSF